MDIIIAIMGTWRIAAVVSSAARNVALSSASCGTFRLGYDVTVVTIIRVEEPVAPLPTLPHLFLDVSRWSIIQTLILPFDLW